MVPSQPLPWGKETATMPGEWAGDRTPGAPEQQPSDLWPACPLRELHKSMKDSHTFKLTHKGFQCKSGWRQRMGFLTYNGH